MSERSRAATLGVLAVLALGGGRSDPGAPVVSPSPTAADLLRAADEARAPVSQGVIRIRASTVGNEKVAVQGDLDVFLGGDNAMLAVFRSGKQQGRKILAVGDDAWLIVPGTRNPIPVGAEQRLAGSVAIADLARLQLSASYRADLRSGSESCGDTACRVLDLVALAPDVQHPTGVLWIGWNDHLPRRLLLRLPSGKDAKAISFLGYRRELGRQVLDRLEVADLLRPRAGATRIEFLAYEPRALAAELFTVEGARALP